MPRVKGSPSKCIKSGNPSNPACSWLFLIKGDLVDQGGRPLDIVKLRHPASGETAMFLFSPNNETVQELITFSEDKRSWFIDDTVKQDGKLQLSTPFDPLFLVVPYLAKATATAPLEQLLHDEQFPETSRLLKCSGMQNLSVIADRKGDEDLNAYKFNEEKLMKWLEKKSEKVAEVLKSKNVHVLGGSLSATFVKSSADAVASKEAFMKYAHGIISEYLSEDLSAKLYQHLKLPPDETTSAKRKSVPASDQKDVKKIKLDDENVSEVSKGDALDLSKSEKQADKLTAKDKARQKAAQGSKSIMSFFKKS
ncbi:ribonuclease H2 subunit B isoform X1 [Frankliniella occidentalis]|uniref:Ribonuclease H2 subunit B n=1 Tax=Frankliniella occidentalis TaxID=133901 RepID=A0A6J1SII7_FRAOC|nr:ribonuclease H2 subunit B isoform X1 [Frankliniella occidentalis]XP_026278397.2 ribonuclease H2 subunit B isoform X1 [Frankliniella occidentalis]